MKILVIPDGHGRPNWKRVVNDMYDKIIFLGDYMDSFEFTHKECFQMLQEIVYFKKANPDRVVLCIGNHDLHYIFFNTPLFDELKASGFNERIAWSANQFYNENLKEFVPLYQIDNYLFSHAGITNSAWTEYFLPKYSGQHIDEFVNELWTKRDRALFTIGEKRGGSDLYGSIFWADAREHYNNYLDGYDQIVGHTPVQKINKLQRKNESITFVDKYPQDNYLIMEV